MQLTIDELLDYTEEERAKRQDWFSVRGNDPLKIALAGGTLTNWERIHEIEAQDLHIQGSARKSISHVLVHEIRHWAQVALAVRQRDMIPPADHDLLFSRLFGPLVRRV